MRMKCQKRKKKWHHPDKTSAFHCLLQPPYRAAPHIHTWKKLGTHFRSGRDVQAPSRARYCGTAPGGCPSLPRQGVTHMHNEQVDPLPQQHTPPPTQTTTPPSLTCKFCHFLHPLPRPRLPCESVSNGGCGSRAGCEGVPPAERRGGVSGQ